METLHHDNSALPTFNDDGPFAVQLLAVIVSIYLSMKQSRRRTCSPKKKSIFGASRLFRVTVCSHFDGECVICGAGMKYTWLVRYPYRSLQLLWGLMAPLPRVY